MFEKSEAESSKRRPMYILVIVLILYLHRVADVIFALLFLVMNTFTTLPWY